MQCYGPQWIYWKWSLNRPNSYTRFRSTDQNPHSSLELSEGKLVTFQRLVRTIAAVYTHGVGTVVSIMWNKHSTSSHGTHTQTKYSEQISVPWWNAECDRAIKNKKHAFNRRKRTRLQTDIIIFKRCRAKAQRTILAAKETSWRHYCSSITNNAKLAKVWRTIDKFSGKRASTHIPSLTHSGITGRNEQHKAHILASHYALSNVDTHYPSEYFTKLPHLQIALQRDLQLTSPTDPRLNEPFSLAELQAVIRRSPNTAPGLDNICYQMFKHMTPVSKWYFSYSTATGFQANYPPQIGSTI